MLDEQIDQMDDSAVFRLLTAPWEDLGGEEKDQAREAAHRVGRLLAKQRRAAYTQMTGKERGQLLYGPKQHMKYVVRGFGEVGDAERVDAVSYWEQLCKTGEVLRDPRFRRTQVTLMGELARAFTAVRLAREALADVAATEESSWTVVRLVEMWALAPVFENETGGRAIAVRDRHACLLVKELARGPEIPSAKGAGSISPAQLLEVLAGRDAELFRAGDEVTVEWSEDFGTYVLTW